MFTKKRKFTVQINYKSSRHMIVECDDMSIKHNNGVLTSISWSNAYPDPIHIGIGEIESIYQLRP